MSAKTRSSEQPSQGTELASHVVLPDEFGDRVTDPSRELRSNAYIAFSKQSISDPVTESSDLLKWYSKPAKEWAMLVLANEIPGHILLPAPNGLVAIAQALMMTLVLGGIMYSPIFASSMLSLGSISGNGVWSLRLMVQLQQLGFHPTNVMNPLLGREQIAHIKPPGQGDHLFQKCNELFLIITTHSTKRDLSNNRAREPTHLFRQVDDGKPCFTRQPYRRYEVGKLFLSERTEGFDHLHAQEFQHTYLAHLPPVISVGRKRDVCRFVKHDIQCHDVWPAGEDEVVSFSYGSGQLRRRYDDGGDLAQLQVHYGSIFS
nr:hypothetical protein Iba_chr13aCG9150 [Ipomoea batatas]